MGQVWVSGVGSVFSCCQRAEGSRLRAPSLWDGDTAWELSGEGGIWGFCTFQREFGLQKTLLSCPGARWQSRVGKGMWDGFVVPTLGIAQGGHWEVGIPAEE